MKKRIISILLAVVFTFGVLTLPNHVAYADTGTADIVETFGYIQQDITVTPDCLLLPRRGIYK